MADNIFRGIQVWGDAANPIPISAPAGGISVSAPVGGAYTDRSIANATGASQQLMAANANRKALIIQNVGVNPIAVNLTGGAAALNTAGSIMVQPGGSIFFDSYPPTSAITAIGTLNDDITALEG